MTTATTILSMVGGVWSERICFASLACFRLTHFHQILLTKIG